MGVPGRGRLGIEGAADGPEWAPTGGIARAITVEWGGSDFFLRIFEVCDLDFSEAHPRC